MQAVLFIFKSCVQSVCGVIWCGGEQLSSSFEFSLWDDFVVGY